jgi:hypothetical protein
LKLKPSHTKSEFQTAISAYQLESFARACFRKHRKGSRFQHRFLPIESLISFQTRPLKKPLLQAIPAALKKVGACLFHLLLEYTNVKPCLNESACLRKILHVLRENRIEITDELYFQLIKQTINNSNSPSLHKTWQLFLIVATIFPSTRDRYPWILSHIARSTTDQDSRIASIATLTFMRYQTRHYLKTPLSYQSNLEYLNVIPTEVDKGTAVFGCLLYECMWNQRKAYPRLPIPFILYELISKLKERGAFHTYSIFQLPGNEGIIQSIRVDVNRRIEILAIGDVNVLANLLKMWLKELPNPIVPIELIDSFTTMAEQGKYLGFVEMIPQVHQLSLLYIVGFVRELVQHVAETGMEKTELAMIFGPLIVNPAMRPEAELRKFRN